MKTRAIILLAGVVFLAFIFQQCENYSAGESESGKEIPITTSSEEARTFYVDARDLQDLIRLSESKAFLDEAVAQDPDFAMAHLLRAFASNSNVEFDQYLRQAVKLKDNVSDGERIFIEIAEANSNNNVKKLKALSLQLTEMYPEDKRAHMWMAIAHRNENEFDKELASLQKVVEIDPDFSNAYNRMGYTNLAKGDLPAAEEAFKKYIEVLPYEANPYDSYGDLLTRMGRYEEAIENFKKAYELNNSFDFSIQKVGNNQVLMGRYDEGRESYKKTMEIAMAPSTRVSNKYLIAQSYLYEDDFEQFFLQADDAIALAESENLPEMMASFHANKCHAYLEMGNTEMAKKSMEACRQVVENSKLTAGTRENFDHMTMIDAALIEAKNGNFNKAHEMANDYNHTVLAGNDPTRIDDYHFLMGYIYQVQGNHSEAIDHLSQTNKNDVFSKYLLAVSTEANGDIEGAALLYKEVAEWNQPSASYALVRPRAIEKVESNI